MESPPRVGTLTFGDCELDLGTGELRRGDRVTALGGLPARLLGLLAWKNGELATRDEIQRWLWPDGTVVDFDQSINQHVRQLRQALGDSAARPAWIQTLPARGYRLLVGARYAPRSGTGARPAWGRGAAPDSPAGMEVPPAQGPPLASSRGAAPDSPAGMEVPPAQGPPLASSREAVPDLSAAPPAPDAPLAPDREGASDSPAAPDAPAVPDLPVAPDPPVARDATPTPDPLPTPPVRARRLPRAVRRLSAPVLLAVICTFAASGSAPRHPAEATPAATPSSSSAIRIAVIPLTADDPASEPRAIGLTEDVITALGETYAPGLEAIALRTMLRYRDRPAPEAALAEELGVDYLVEGRVRSHADRLRITVQLVRARDAAQLWARTFEQPHTAGWAVDVAIAEDVAATLGRLLLTRRAAPDEPLDAAARDAFTRGRYLQSQRRPRLAAAAFVEATERAPRSARAWAARAAAELQTGDRQVLASVTRALALDAEQPEANFVRATLAFYGEWNIELAFRHYRAAIRANPGYAEAHHAMAACYSATGRHDEAIAAMARARSLDPLAPEVVSDVGWYYYFARRFDDAAAWCTRTLELEPTFYWAHRCIVLSRGAAGDRRGAIEAALAALGARAASPAAVGEIARAADPLAAFWRWELAHPDDSTDPSDRAATRAVLGELDGALDDLEHAIATHRGWLLPFLDVAPSFDAVRAAPRFQRVVAQVHAGTTLR